MEKMENPNGHSQKTCFHFSTTLQKQANAEREREGEIGLGFPFYLCFLLLLLLLLPLPPPPSLNFLLVGKLISLHIYGSFQTSNSTSGSNLCWHEGPLLCVEFTDVPSLQEPQLPLLKREGKGRMGVWVRWRHGNDTPAHALLKFLRRTTDDIYEK